MANEKDAELDFFAATDVAARADLFSEMDPERHREGLIWPLLAGLAVLAIGAVYLLVPDSPAQPEQAAKAAPAVVKKATPAPPAETASEVDVVAAFEGSPPQVRPVVAARVSPSATPPLPAVDAASTTSAEPSGAENPPAPTAERFDPWLARTLKRHAEATPAPTAAPAPVPAPEGVATGDLAAVRTQLKAGEFSAVARDLEARTPTPEVRALLGRAYYELGRDADALKTLELARDGGDQSPTTLLLLGDLLQSRDAARARNSFEAFLAHHPGSPMAGEVKAILRNM